MSHFSVPKEMHVHIGPARVFDTEDLAVEALLSREVKPGDVVIIRYEGPKGGPGMREMLAVTGAMKGCLSTEGTMSDAEAVERARAWAAAWGTGSGASRLVTGTLELHGQRQAA